MTEARQDGLADLGEDSGFDRVGVRIDAAIAGSPATVPEASSR
jgi:hypothetical protein